MSEQVAIVRPRIHSAKKDPLQDLVPLATPISVHIDVCSICNFKCSFCFQADVKGMKAVNLKRDYMPIELFKKIVDDLEQFPDRVKKIKIGNHGEPTLHPKLGEMVRYASEKGYAEVLEIFTNGSRLTPELNSSLVAGGLQRINISLEGLSDERYREVAGVKQSFSDIVAGVEDLFRKKTEAGSPLKIYVKIADEAHALKGDAPKKFTLDEREQKFFFKTFASICDEMFIEKVVPQWAETQLDKQNEVGSTGMYGQPTKEWKKVCPFTFMYLHFNCDGTVSPCTLDWPRKVVVGDSRKQTVKEIWQGERLRALQTDMLCGRRDEINFCKSCSAPMVCVEEDLDPHADALLEAVDPEGVFRKQKGQVW